MTNPWRTSVWFELMLDLTSLTSAVCTAAECSRAAEVWPSRHCGRSRRGLSIDWLRGEILKLIRRSLQRLLFVCGLRFSFACVCVCVCVCDFLNNTGGQIDLVFSTHMAPNVIDFYLPYLHVAPHLRPLNNILCSCQCKVWPDQ